uniref:DUF659 domain-containing protein n=1 Tax=Trichogramma kaykai TaxID=54128 RepID=A0ABD2XCC5_9HYME
MTGILKDKYFYLAEKLKKTFAKIEGLSMTTDIWTDTINTKSYLGLTAYYIEENDIKTAILGVHELDSNHTSDNVQLWILEMLNEWDLPTTKILAVIADGAANIKSALTTIFGGSKVMHCFAHTLNLVVLRALDNIKEVSEILKKLKGIVTFFKHSECI